MEHYLHSSSVVGTPGPWRHVWSCGVMSDTTVPLCPEPCLATTSVCCVTVQRLLGLRIYVSTYLDIYTRTPSSLDIYTTYGHCLVYVDIYSLHISRYLQAKTALSSLDIYSLHISRYLHAKTALSSLDIYNHYLLQTFSILPWLLRVVFNFTGISNATDEENLYPV